MDESFCSELMKLTSVAINRSKHEALVIHMPQVVLWISGINITSIYFGRLPDSHGP